MFNTETLRKPLDTKVLKSKSPGSNSTSCAWEAHGLSFPAGKIQLLGNTKVQLPHQSRGAGRVGRAVALPPRYTVPQYLDKKSRLGDRNQGQPQLRQVWGQVSGTRQVARAWALAQPPGKQGKLPSRLFPALLHHPNTCTESGLASSTGSPNHWRGAGGHANNPSPTRLISCWKLQIRIRWFSSTNNKPKPKHRHANKHPHFGFL